MGALDDDVERALANRVLDVFAAIQRDRKYTLFCEPLLKNLLGTVRDSSLFALYRVRPNSKERSYSGSYSDEPEQSE